MVAHLSGDGAVGVDLNLRRSESFKEGFCPFGIVIMHLCDCRALRRERVTRTLELKKSTQSSCGVITVFSGTKELGLHIRIWSFRFGA